ncbi:hypothetical protein TWF102_004881 [Orbilia oligospora]|uniref:Uncharacterized protein n=1 Tax=Orbilia oligospora TaxID=2813651 RepID=A0A7C8J883_ORBOL|nr:hypothetical protein TWF102_004881 [Orbilia oligospora]
MRIIPWDIKLDVDQWKLTGDECLQGIFEVLEDESRTYILTDVPYAFSVQCKRLFYKHRVEPQTQPTPLTGFAANTKKSHNETIFLKLLWSYD